MQKAPEIDVGHLELLGAIVEQAPDAIIFADREGLIRVWNRGAERVFGHIAAEVIGRSLDIIIPERLRRAHWDGFNAALASGRTKYEGRALTTRSTHKDGSKLYVDLSFALVRDKSGSVVGALAIGRDGTAHRDAQSAMRDRIAALEQALEAASPKGGEMPA
jgi:PAS domain S-box-containing protein